VTQVRNNSDALMAIQLATVRITLAKLTADGALEAMRNGVGGYKSTASGSDTSGGGNRTITVPDERGIPDVVPVTGVEAAVLSKRTDTAIDDLAAVYGALSRLCDAAVLVSDIFARWNPPRQLTTKDVRDTTKDLWCSNPAHGEHNLEPRTTKRTYIGWPWCTRCAEFRSTNGGLPDKDLYDWLAQGHNMNSRAVDLWKARQRAGSRGKGKKAA
jgi:hypothetical protein